jgi:hypothetical protein
MDHVAGSNDETRMFNNTVGRGLTIKDHAMKVALEMAA